MRCDLFYLALWVSKAGVGVAHFNMSRLGVPNHMLLLARVSTGQIYYLKSLLTQLQSHLAEFLAVAKNLTAALTAPITADLSPHAVSGIAG